MKWIIIIVVGKELHMNSLKRIAVAVCLVAAIAALVPAMRADETHWPTIVSFTESVRIGDRVFPPGSYLIQRSPNIVTSRVAMIYSYDRQRWEGIIIGVPARREGDIRDSIITYEKQGQGQPEALRYWFFQDLKDGMEFPNRHSKTTQNAGNSSGSLTTIIARAAK